MEEKYKVLLNKEKSVKSVNKTSHVPVNLQNSSNLLPLSNEQTVVNSYEQFEKERVVKVLPNTETPNPEVVFESEKEDNI